MSQFIQKFVVFWGSVGVDVWDHGNFFELTTALLIPV